jgi:endonuclease YncB( thermonuclease family)
MHRLADGRRVTLVTDPSQSRWDIYGRLLAYAVRNDGLNLNRAMVRRGWAEVYVYDRPFRRLRSFRRAQRSARHEDLGVWRRCGGDFHTPARTRRRGRAQPMLRTLRPISRSRG